MCLIMQSNYAVKLAGAQSDFPAIAPKEPQFLPVPGFTLPPLPLPSLCLPNVPTSYS